MSTLEGQSELLERFPYGTEGEFIWPVTLLDFKGHAQIGHKKDDVLLLFGSGGYLASATIEIENRGQIALIEQKRRLLLDRLPSDETIFLPRGPVSAITTIKYLDIAETEQTLSPSLYRFVGKGNKSQIYFKSTATAILADGPGTVWIDYVAGFGQKPTDVPATWRTLVAAVAFHLYERRDMVAAGLDQAFERVIERKVIAAGAVRRYV